MRAANIPELVGNILKHLEFFDLLRVQRVRRRWRDCVQLVNEVQKFIHRTPVALKVNSHFKSLDDAAALIQLPDGTSLIDTLKNSDVNFCASLLDSFVSQPENPEDYENLEDIEEQCFDDYRARREDLQSILEHDLGPTNDCPSAISDLACPNCE